MSIAFNKVSDLTPEQIDALKKEYGRLFKTTVADTQYIIRPMYKSDWDIIAMMLKDNPNLAMPELDDKIVEMCLVGPKPDLSQGGWSTLPAGVIPTLSKFISVKSGFIVPDLAEVSQFQLEPLFEEEKGERPDEEAVAELKRECPFNLKLVGIDSEYFVLRPITRQEWRFIVKNSTDESEQDTKVVEKAVMWPKGINWATKPAGYVDTLSQICMNISGYAGPSTVEEL